jgi:tetratricopeptide (TPR) repeat protein
MTRSHEYETWFDKAVTLQEEKNYTEALTCFQKAIDIKPDFIPAWVYKGICLEQLEQYEAAIECYNQAIQINPNVADLWYNKGTTYCTLKRYNDALSCFERVLEIEPDNAMAQTTRSLILATPEIFKIIPQRSNPNETNTDEPSEEVEISLERERGRQSYSSLWQNRENEIQE